MMIKNISFFLVSTLLLLVSCNTENTTTLVYYVNYNTKIDKLDSALNSKTSGKLLFYDENKKFNIIPASYKTRDYKGMRLLKLADELPTAINENTIRYDVTVSDSLFIDSTSYNILKYIFKNGNWKLKSNMSNIQALTSVPKQFQDKYFNYLDLANIIVNTIAYDTFDE